MRWEGGRGALGVLPLLGVGMPAIRPAGSRGQCPGANGGSSRGQAVRCEPRRMRALRAPPPEHPLMRPELGVKWERCFLPDREAGLQPHLQT